MSDFSILPVLAKHCQKADYENIVGWLHYDISGSKIGQRDLSAIFDGKQPQNWQVVNFVNSEAFDFLAANSSDQFDSDFAILCTFTIACRFMCYKQGYHNEIDDLGDLFRIGQCLVRSGFADLCFDLFRLTFSLWGQ